MAKVIAAIALAFVLAQDRPGQDRPGQDKPGQDKPGQDRAATQDLDQALSKAGMMNNYTATITMKKDGMDKPGAREGLQPIEFRVMPGLAYHIKSGQIEGYRQGEVFIIKEGGSWKRFEGADSKGLDRDNDRKSGDRSGNQGGENPSDRGQDRGVNQDKGNISNEKLAKLRAPHEILRDLKSSSFKQVRREDTEGSRVFSGELTDEAIRSILAGKQRGVGAAGDRNLKQGTGNAKIWINGEGAVTKYELVIDHKAEAGKMDAKSGKMTKTVEFRDVGSTKYEVPAEATKILGTKTDRPSDRPTDRPTDKPSDKPMDDDKKDDDQKDEDKKDDEKKD